MFSNLTVILSTSRKHKKAGEIKYYPAAFGKLCLRDRVINRFSLGLFIPNADLNEISDKKSTLAHSGEWRLITSRSFPELINLHETECQTDELIALPDEVRRETGCRLATENGAEGGG